ncbi:type III endosome membrane protein TEMP [Chanodichthys erythropterus]|uniref:type III endosome membrane protein TEMP n=1 Tax=Chanodichthys erythropterus TaxID=933992 RepID=UPI00351DE353
MGSATHTVCVLLCFWVSGSCYTLQTLGPCTVNRETAAFDCSGKTLTSIPQHIWMNVTELDLSDNLLDLTHSDSFKRLNLFSHLVTLNLSGNYLPLLLKDHLYSLSSLKVLDLSRCKLAAVEANALTSLSSLQMLFLGNIPSAAVQDLRLNQFVQLGGEPNNRQEVGNRVKLIRDSKSMTQDDHNDGYSKDVNHGAFLRKLLTVETNITTTTNNGTKATGIDDPKMSSESWKVLVAVLVSAISLSVLIALMAKFKVVHKYLASYRHSRLSEVDATSQCDTANFEVGFSSHGGPGIRTAASTNDNEEDDDGFIEDNYIQASESERATRAAAALTDDEEEEEIEFSIG